MGKIAVTAEISPHGQVMDGIRSARWTGDGRKSYCRDWLRADDPERAGESEGIGEWTRPHDRAAPDFLANRPLKTFLQNCLTCICMKKFNHDKKTDGIQEEAAVVLFFLLRSIICSI